MRDRVAVGNNHSRNIPSILHMALTLLASLTYLCTFMKSIPNWQYYVHIMFPLPGSHIYLLLG